MCLTLLYSITFFPLQYQTNHPTVTMATKPPLFFLSKAYNWNIYFGSCQNLRHVFFLLLKIMKISKYSNVTILLTYKTLYGSEFDTKRVVTRLLSRQTVLSIIKSSHIRVFLSKLLSLTLISNAWYLKMRFIQ